MCISFESFEACFLALEMEEAFEWEVVACERGEFCVEVRECLMEKRWVVLELEDGVFEVEGMVSRGGGSISASFFVFTKGNPVIVSADLLSALATRRGTLNESFKNRGFTFSTVLDWDQKDKVR